MQENNYDYIEAAEMEDMREAYEFAEKQRKEEIERKKYKPTKSLK